MTRTWEKRIADTWNIGNSAREVVYVQQRLTIRKLRHHEVVKPGDTLLPKGTRNWN